MHLDFFTPYSLDVMGKTLKSEQCKILNKYNLKPLKGIFPYEYLWFTVDD